MDRIPNIFPPADDELLYSYLYRLGQVNGFAAYRDFYIAFLAEEQDAKAQLKARRCCTYDGNFRLSRLFDRISAVVKDFDVIRFFLDHTWYGIISPLMTNFQQEYYINYCFESAGTHQDLSAYPTRQIEYLAYCPECKKEELSEGGFWYYHREHQMPGVKVCFKHNVPLMQCRQKKNEEFSETEADTALEVQFPDTEYDYARFVHEFTEQEFDADLRDFKFAAAERIREITDEKANADAVMSYIKNSKRDCITTDNILLKAMPGKLKTDNRREDKAMMMKLLFLLFPSASDITKYLPDHASERQRFMDTLTDYGYSLLSPYKKSIVLLKHDICGTEYCTTPYAFQKGWLCPSCDADLNNNVFFARMVSMCSSNEYELHGPFNGMNNKVMIRHKECGNIYPVLANSFTQLGSGCRCQREVTFETAREKVEQDGQYRLKTFTNKSERMEVLHTVCGNTFRISYKVKKPICPYCFPNGKRLDMEGFSKIRAKAHIPTESFMQTIKNLTGDEYSLESEYKGADPAVKMRHNTCGQSFMISPRRFKYGYRCPYCSKIITADYLKEAVDRISGGRYKAVPSEKRDYFLVTDTITGKQEYLQNKMILQELFRPTPSYILPLEQKFPFHDNPGSLIDRVLAWLKDNQSKKPLFSLKDLARDCGMDIAQARHCTNRKEWQDEWDKWVVKVNRYYDLYLFRGTADDTAIRKYFTEPADEVTGIVVGKSFLYEIGYLEEKPDTVNILTNDLDKQHLNFEFNGMKYKIKKSDVKITRDNYRIIPVLELFVDNKVTIDNRLYMCCMRYCRDHGVSDISMILDMRYSRAYQRMLDTTYTLELPEDLRKVS